MSVINSGLKRKDYSDHSSYSYSGIGPKEATIRITTYICIKVSFLPVLFELWKLMEPQRNSNVGTVKGAHMMPPCLWDVENVACIEDNLVR